MADRAVRIPTYASTGITAAFAVAALAGALYVQVLWAWIGFGCWAVSTVAVAFNTYRVRNGKPVTDAYRPVRGVR